MGKNKIGELLCDEYTEVDFAIAKTQIASNIVNHRLWETEGDFYIHFIYDEPISLTLSESRLEARVFLSLFYDILKSQMKDISKVNKCCYVTCRSSNPSKREWPTYVILEDSLIFQYHDCISLDTGELINIEYNDDGSIHTNMGDIHKLSNNKVLLVPEDSISKLAYMYQLKIDRLNNTKIYIAIDTMYNVYSVYKLNQFRKDGPIDNMKCSPIFTKLESIEDCKTAIENMKRNKGYTLLSNRITSYDDSLSLFKEDGEEFAIVCNSCFSVLMPGSEYDKRVSNNEIVKDITCPYCKLPAGKKYFNRKEKK